MKIPLSTHRAALLSALTFISTQAAAQSASVVSPQEEVLVTASRLGGIRSDLLGSSATILEPIDLQLRQTVIVSDILRDVPGVAVSRTGPVGQFTQVRMRGAEANHTLVLIDGIKASDPFYGEFEFETLIADDVAKIEVLRGEQSALYGSDAIGGVIHYITATGAEAPGLRGRIEGGSFGGVNGSLRAAGVVGALDYAISGAYSRDDGVPDNPLGIRKLGSENGALAGKFSYAFSDIFRLKAVARYSATNADLNEQNFDFPPGPEYGLEQDGNGSYRNRALYGLLSGEFELLDGQWKNAVTVQGVDAERNGYGNGGSPHDLRTSGDKGERQKASYVTSFGFTSSEMVHTLTGAVDWEREYYQNTDPFKFADTSRRHGDTLGLVGSYDVVIQDRFAVGASARFDKNYRFKDDFTYRAQASYRFDNGFRPHVAAGTGTKAPLIYQLYGFTPGPSGFSGNPNLKPETSDGLEAGFDQSFFGGMALAGLTYFHSTLKDEIFVSFIPPTFAASPQNATTSSKREGVEASLSARLGTQWRADLAYTYTNSVQNGAQEVRRAPNIASLNLSWRASDDQFGLNATVRYNGEQKDFQFTPVGSNRVNLPSYTLVNLGADYRINEAWQLYGRVENLLDRKPQEIFSFRGVDRAFYAGIRAQFQ
ncbi:MAG: vitamin transporter [Alphaproteobacteria bacterium]|nr:vitamin transporter [Alphaproteobacteria bacterium]